MKYFFLLLFISMPFLTNGQFSEPKIGKVELSDLSMSKYDKDTTAGALMLFDNGHTEFTLNSDTRFQFVYDRHCQIKLFKNSSFHVADMSIRLYKNSTRREDLKNLKATTYNLVDGKVVKTKLDNDNIYKTDGKNYTDVTFTFPAIKEGSVIELSYTIISDFLYSLRGWTFQYDYPARWSQYSYVIPEYFDYREAAKGYLSFDVNKKEDGSTLYSIAEEREAGTMLTSQAVRQNYTLKAATKITTLALKDVPAFISEPNIDCEDNYIQAVEFELSSIEYPNQIRKDYTQSWESVNTQMKDDEDFGLLLKSNGFIKDTVAAICQNKVSDIDKASGIYSYVQKRMKWNGDYRIWATKGLRKPFEDRLGSSSEINLLLTMMLQTAGLKADPVMFSTRENGIANTYFPTISKFNSILTQVYIGGTPVLLDPVNKYCVFGVLPANDINGKGRVVNSGGGDWANLAANEKYKRNVLYSLDITPDGKLTGRITGNYDGYAGINYRYALNSEKNADDYFRKQQESLKGLTINKYSIADRFNINRPLSDTLNVEISDHVEIIGDKILFSPLLFETLEKNRYTLETRKYPVDYNYPISEVYVFNYTLPSGYKVESLPQPAILKLPDNSIMVSYDVKNIDNKIIIEYKRDVNKILFLPDDYIKLKNLYDEIVKKHAEQIILKKSI